MCVSPIHTCLFIGMLIPAMRAMATYLNPDAACDAGPSGWRKRRVRGAPSCSPRSSSGRAEVASRVLAPPAAVADQLRLLQLPEVVILHRVRLELDVEVHHHQHHHGVLGAAD